MSLKSDGISSSSFVVSGMPRMMWLSCLLLLSVIEFVCFVRTELIVEEISLSSICLEFLTMSRN